MSESFYAIAIIIVVVCVGLLMWLISMYKKVSQGQVLVRTGQGGVKIFFNAGMVIPILHKEEIMDISVKKLDISRMGKDGLICKDNLRADIKVAFFVRVNKSVQDIINVAQTIGCARASDHETLENLFEAKFSEALKTVGKKLFTNSDLDSIVRGNNSHDDKKDFFIKINLFNGKRYFQKT